jgi:hypothetical protein
MLSFGWHLDIRAFFGETLILGFSIRAFLGETLILGFSGFRSIYFACNMRRHVEAS